jgi:hypothetical protein
MTEAVIYLKIFKIFYHQIIFPLAGYGVPQVGEKSRRKTFLSLT